MPKIKVSTYFAAPDKVAQQYDCKIGDQGFMGIDIFKIASAERTGRPDIAIWPRKNQEHTGDYIEFDLDEMNRILAGSEDDQTTAVRN